MKPNIFLQGLINHLLKCNRAEILNRSLLNCHAEGLHSIMLLECPEKTIRLFVADTNHTLWGNCPEHFENHQSIGFHAHHCELTLLPIKGQVDNWTVTPSISDTNGFIVSQYRYNSKITDGKIGFAKLGKRLLETTEYTTIPLGESKYLTAKDKHTVYVPKGETAAWFVFEGKNKPSKGKSHCWSTSELDKQDFTNFYKPMNEDELVRLLNLAFSE